MKKNTTDYTLFSEAIVLNDENSSVVISKFYKDIFHIKYLVECGDYSEFKKMDISKDDGIIYDMFNELYNSIKEFRPFGIEKENMSIEQRELYEEREKIAKKMPGKYTMFDDEKIVCYSDNYNLILPPKLIIEKTYSGYSLVFERCKNNYGEILDHPNFDVVIYSDNDNKYYPLNKNFYDFFNILYNKLNNESDKSEEYDEQFHQISFEEYLNKPQKILVKKF